MYYLYYQDTYVGNVKDEVTYVISAPFKVKHHMEISIDPNRG